MSDDLNTEIKIGADASGVEAGVGKAKRSLKDLGDAAKKAGKDAADGVEGIGDGGDKAAKKLAAAAGRMRSELQKVLAEQQAGEKGSRAYWEALADTRGISRNAIKPILDQIDQAKAKTKEAETAALSWQSALTRIGPAMGAVFSGAAIAGAVGKVVSVQREFDVLNSSLKTVTGSSAAAEREFAWLKTFAKDTPYGLAQATQGFIKMQALGLEPTRAKLTSFGNTASAMGKDLTQMIEAVADASTGEFERLKEFGIKAKVEGDKVSLTFQGVTKTVENSAKDITKYLEDIGNNQFGGAMAERAKTLDGAISGLGDTWDELFRTISSQGAGTLIYDSVTLAAGAVEDATVIFKAFSGATGDVGKELNALASVQGGVATFFETVGVLAANTLYVLKQTGDTLGGLAAGYKAFFIDRDFDAVRRIGEDMRASGESARRDIDALTDRILGARKAQEELAKYKTRNDGAANDPRRTDAPKPADTAASDEAKSVAELAEARRKLYGVDKDYLPTLEMLHRQFTGGKLTLSEYQGLVAKLAEGNYKADNASKSAASAAKAEQDAYRNLVTSIKEKIAANDLELSNAREMTDSQKLIIKLDQELLSGKLKLTAASEKDVRARLAILELQEKEIAARKEALKVAQATASARTKEAEGIEAWMRAQEDAALQSSKSITDRIAGLANEEEAVKLARSTNISLAEAIERVAIARLREKRDGSTGAYKDSPAYKELTDEIELREKLASGIGSKESREKSDDAAKKSAEDWKRTADGINQDLTNAFEQSFMNGESLGKNLAASLKNIFANTVLRPVISAVLSPISGAINGLVSSAIGGATGGGGGGLGTISNLITGAQQGYNLYAGEGLISQAWGGVQGALGIGQAGQVAAAGQSAASMVPGVGGGAGGGMGALGAAGFWAAVAYAIGNAIGVNRKKELVGTGLTGTLGGGDLTPWENFRKPGTVLMGPDYTRVNPLEIYEDYRKRDQEYVKTLKENGGTGTLNGSPYGNDFAATAAMGNSEYLDNIREIAASSKRQSDEIQKGYVAVRKGAVDMANGLGLAGDKLKDFTVALDPEDLNFKDLNAEQISEKIAKVFGDAGKDMAQQVLGTWITETVDVVNSTLISQLTDTTDQLYDVQVDSVTRTRYVASEYAKAGETAFETLTRLSTSFNTLNEAADALGFGIQKGSLALADFSDKFIEAFGGLEKFTASTGAFLQNYYTDTERREYLIRSGVRQAEKLGIQGLTEDKLRNGTREQFRDFVNTAASNPELYADALDLANYLSPIFGAFEEQAPVVQEVANVVDELTQAYQNAVKSLAGDRDSLAVEVLRAQGNEAGAKALERTQYLAQFAGLDAARLKEIETLYDGNMATRAYIQGIKDAAQAQLDAIAKLRADSLALIDGAAGKTDAALAAYERAADKERERLQGNIDSIKAVFQAAEDGAKSFFGEVEAVAKFQGAEGRDFISQALASAQAGGRLPDGKELSDAIAAVGKDFSATQFTSQAEADFQRLVVANELKGLKDASGDQLTEAEKQLDALNKQVEFARDQVNALRGIDTKLKDLPTAIAELIKAYNKESQTRDNVKATALLGSGNATYDIKKGVGTTASGAYFEQDAIIQAAQDAIAQGATASQIYGAIKDSGFSLAQAEQIFGVAPGSLEAIAREMNLPVFHSGTSYVPETGFALLQQGEAGIPAAFNPFNAGSMGNTARMEVLIEVLIERVQSLEATVETGNGYAGTTAGVLKGAQNGSALNTTPVSF